MTATPNRISSVEMHEPGQNPRNVPAYISARALSANTAESITIPTNTPGDLQKVAYVRIAGTVDFYYSFSGVATVPVDTDDGTACELIKAQGDAEWLMIPSGATALSVIAAATAIVTASFYTN